MAEGNLILVDALTFEAPKTKEFAQVLKNLKVDTKTLVVLECENDNAALSARNVLNVTVVSDNNVSVLDVFSNNKLVLTQAALSKLEEALA